VDFFTIRTREIERGKNKGSVEVYPDFKVCRSRDLMVRGRAFHAIWDKEAGLWSTDEYDVQRLVDEELREYAERHESSSNIKHVVRTLGSYGTKSWTNFRQYMSTLSDNSHDLDTSITFQNTPVKKTDYVSRRLSYDIVDAPCAAWDELVSKLYSDSEREKIAWAIGSIIAGDSKRLQKFLVFYGSGGTGKSTILNIIQRMFEGYCVAFEAKALTGNNNQFATEVFRTNPLVAIQHDGDLSKIEDNSKLNSVISHEEITMHEKYKPSYTAKCLVFLFMGTNKPVRISDAKSGLIRRLIDVHPTGERISPGRYNALISQIGFELGAIAHRCLMVYQSLGKNHYNTYRPLEMMLQTDVFFNFVEANFDIFKEQDGATLQQAYALYKEFCSTTGIEWVLPQYKFREEMRNYFETFMERATINGAQVRSYYSGFNARPLKTPVVDKDDMYLMMDDEESILDKELGSCPAQLAKEDGTPRVRWVQVNTTLDDIDTTQLHYVKVPENHIVIDFDLKDENGAKSRDLNLRAASEWPSTYGEYSKSGSGVHLHYRYTGEDPARLRTSYSDGIEVKVFAGDSSLRRRVSRCNNLPIADISGLPLKEQKVLGPDTMSSERGVRDLIARNLAKEIHPGTKPSVDFIAKVLDDAYQSGISYDVTDMRSAVIAFANSSSHQALTCLKTVQKMRWKSDEERTTQQDAPPPNDERVVFFDVEVFPNLLVVCWKFEGASDIVRMINPQPREIEGLFRFKLVGFNNRRYDNHILYARYLGYDCEQLYELSQKIISGSVGALFGEAYNLSFADIYDFSSKKQTLKKFEIELGIKHVELGLPWDQPVDVADWPRVVEYCCYDVEATEATFNARKGDYDARRILAALSGLTINDTTQKHTAKIIFGDDRRPQSSFVYTDLSREFPGYVYDNGTSTYKGETVGEGGYVYAEPGMYENVALLDVASMHPTSIRELNLFGDYTPRFWELVEARLAIKRGEIDRAKTMLGGCLAEFLADSDGAKALSYALKIVINIVYGLTSAKFDNPFRDPRNKDNIVAKRGALFMIDLQQAVQERGFTVAHIKTDSIKIPDATPEIIKFVMDFGARYGYTFEHEATYKQLCLVNDAVYIAREEECTGGVHWTAVGAQFQHPYVFKKLFLDEKPTYEDCCETKQVSQGAMYLDTENIEKPVADDPRMENWRFVGKTGLFVPVKDGFGGATLYRVKDGKPYAVTGTKGYRWLEAEVAGQYGLDGVDLSYFEDLAANAINAIDYFGPFASFIK
jgi:hypothetical protein